VSGAGVVGRPCAERSIFGAAAGDAAIGEPPKRPLSAGRAVGWSPLALSPLTLDHHLVSGVARLAAALQRRAGLPTRPAGRRPPLSRITTSPKVWWMSMPVTRRIGAFLSVPTTGAAGRHDTCGSARAAQPGESQKRPSTNPSPKRIAYIGPPAPSCSRRLCRGGSQHTPPARKPTAGPWATITSYRLRTLSRALSPPSAIEPFAPRARCRSRPQNSWCLLWSGGLEKIAQTEWRKPVAARHRRRHVHRTASLNPTLQKAAPPDRASSAKVRHGARLASLRRCGPAPCKPFEGGEQHKALRRKHHQSGKHQIGLPAAVRHQHQIAQPAR